MNANPSDELAAYTFTHGDAEFIHQHEVDARGASENLQDAKPIRVFFALAGLYLMLEKGYTGRQVQAAHMQMAKVKRVWPRFTPPAVLPSISAADIMREEQGHKRDAAIIRWCEAVWAAWSDEHEAIRTSTDTLLEGWLPPRDKE